MTSSITHPISISLPVSPSINPLEEAVDTFIAELDCMLRVNGSAAVYFKYVENLLDRCLTLADGDPMQIDVIRESFDEYNERSKHYPNCKSLDIIYNLIKKSQFSLAQKLIDLEVNEITNSTYSLLCAAIKKGNSELVAHLLQVHPQIDKEKSLALDVAVQYGDKECIKLLLQAGVNPNISIDAFGISPFDRAAMSDKLSLLPLFFLYKKPGFTLDTESAKKKLQYKRVVMREGWREDFQNSIAKTLPSLDKDVPCFTRYFAGRENAVQHFLKPLIDPIPSVKNMVTPLRDFVMKEKSDPRFMISIKSSKDYASTNGEYSHATKNIELYVSPKTYPFGPVPYPLVKLDKKSDPVLLHELCHKFIDKARFDSSNAKLVDAINKDIRLFNLFNWKLCHPIIVDALKGISNNYPAEQRSEEYLVRIIQIIHSLAEENPSSWEMYVRKGIPNLYKYYKEKFLPAIRDYNSKPA